MALEGYEAADRGVEVLLIPVKYVFLSFFSGCALIAPSQGRSQHLYAGGFVCEKSRGKVYRMLSR